MTGRQPHAGQPQPEIASQDGLRARTEIEAQSVRYPTTRRRDVQLTALREARYTLLSYRRDCICWRRATASPPRADPDGCPNRLAPASGCGLRKDANRLAGAEPRVARHMEEQLKVARRRVTFKDVGFGILATGGAILLLGFGIGSTIVMPKNAIVYLDMTESTYLSPPCVADSRRYEISTAAEAYSLSFRPDAKCRNAGGFVQDGRSLSGEALERIGLLPPLKRRWNADGTWNW